MKQKLKTLKKKLSFKRHKFKKVKYGSTSQKDNEIIIESESILKPIKIRNPGVDLGSSSNVRDYYSSCFNPWKRNYEISSI